MISQSILAQERFATKLTHKHCALHVNHLSMCAQVRQTGKPFATIWAHMLEVLFMYNFDMRSQSIVAGQNFATIWTRI
jgi:hypothetical protein